MAEFDEGKKSRLHRSRMKVKYPYNMAYISEAGHEVHFDNTPGNERIRWAHKDGTYTEISKGGKKVEYVVGGAQAQYKSGFTMSVDNNHDVAISGHHRFNVNGGSHIEVKGDANMVVAGSVASIVGGDSMTAVKGNSYVGVAGDMNTNVKGKMDMKVGGPVTMAAKGDFSINAPTIKLNS